MTFARQFFIHIGNVITGDGKKRILYSIVNIVFMALAVLATWGVMKSWDIMFSQTFIGGLILLIICIVFALASIVNGVIGQIVLIVCALISLGDKEQRAPCAVALVIALLSVAALVVTVILII